MACSPGPNADCREENVKTLARQLVTHEPLTVAPRPEDVPAALGGNFGNKHHTNFAQGFAPFGSALVAAKPTLCGS